MFSWYKYLIVSLVFSHLGFWSGNLFLIAPFPDLCLLVPFLFIIWNFSFYHKSQFVTNRGSASVKERNAWDFARIRHVTCIRTPEKEASLTPNV